MPHFVIEYARDVEQLYDIDKIMQIAFDSGVASGEMRAEDLKVRARPYDHYLLVGGRDSFLHVTAFLLSGRSVPQKAAISLLLRENLQDYLGDVTCISIDIRDMDPKAYKKRVLSRAPDAA